MDEQKIAPANNISRVRTKDRAWEQDRNDEECHRRRKTLSCLPLCMAKSSCAEKRRQWWRRLWQRWRWLWHGCGGSISIRDGVGGGSRGMDTVVERYVAGQVVTAAAEVAVESSAAAATAAEVAAVATAAA